MVAAGAVALLWLRFLTLAIWGFVPAYDSTFTPATGWTTTSYVDAIDFGEQSDFFSTQLDLDKDRTFSILSGLLAKSDDELRLFAAGTLPCDLAACIGVDPSASRVIAQVAIDDHRDAAAQASQRTTNVLSLVAIVISAIAAVAALGVWYFPRQPGKAGEEVR